MPHNRAERQAEVDAKFDFVVYGGEYSVFNALLAAADVLLLGGNFTYQFLKDEVTQYGIDLVKAGAQANPPIDPTNEPIYFDYFIFSNWEQPVPGVRIPLPNKFVPYVAARKTPQAPPSDPPPHVPRAFVPAFTEETTSIEQVGQNLENNFAVRTPARPEGGWITPGTPAGFAMAAAASAQGRKLRITYESYTLQPNAKKFYNGVSKIEIV